MWKTLEFSFSQYRVHFTSHYTVSLLSPLFSDFHSSSTQRATLFPILSSSRQFFVRWTRISYALAPCSPRRSPPPSASFSSPSSLLISSTYPHHDFSSLRSGSRPRVPTKWAAPLARARGTQLKVSHTGGHAVPRRAATTESILRLEARFPLVVSSLRSSFLFSPKSIRGCRLYSVALFRFN